MVIISKVAINEFIKQYADSEEPLMRWYATAKNANWANFNQMRQTYNSVDATGNDLYVFNIKGNDYRLVCRIIFGVRTIYVKFIGTHGQYDKLDLTKL